MKIIIKIVLFVVSLCVFISSCQKNYNDSTLLNTPAQSGNLIKLRQGVDIADDTTYLMTYDSLNRLHTITDSAYKDTLFAFYDASSHLSKVIEKYNAGSLRQTSYNYDAAGSLLQIDFTFGGTRERYVFEYVNGVVSRKLYYTDNFNGSALQLYRIYAYVFSGGNITRIDEYGNDNVLDGTKFLTYGTQLNPFKNLALFNYSNNLGTDDIINFETFFCKNIVSGYMAGSESLRITNSFNAQQKPIKIVSNYSEPPNAHIFNWQFTYQ